MFPEATDEVRENNDKFSPCSIKHISKILSLKKDDCFVGEEQNVDLYFSVKDLSVLSSSLLLSSGSHKRLWVVFMQRLLFCIAY